MYSKSSEYSSILSATNMWDARLRDEEEQSGSDSNFQACYQFDEVMSQWVLRTRVKLRQVGHCLEYYSVLFGIFIWGIQNWLLWLMKVPNKC